jgi:HSP20 family molecular chaperone IbpA
MKRPKEAVMNLNDLVTRFRDAIRRSLGRSDDAIRVTELGTVLEPLGDAPVVTPPVDIYENDRELVIYVDVPGASREGTRVSWDGNGRLTLAAKRPQLPSGTAWGSEYEPSECYRSLMLPHYADGSRAIPTVKDGVLTIRVPKRATTSRIVPITAS